MKIFLIVLMLLCSIARGDSFDCMVAVTRQHDSMDWWYAVPGEFVPKIARISQVSKGEFFRIIPIFRNYGVDTNRHANLMYDIEVIRPDGSVDVSLSKCEGHNGPAQPPDLLPAVAVINMCFDQEDEYGAYSIRVLAMDKINSRTNRQSTVVQLRKFEFQTLDKAERDTLFIRYPTSPDPSKAAAAFLQTAEPFFDEENEPVWSAIWFFKKIFEQNDYIIPHLLDEFPFATRKQKQDIIFVMALLDKTDRLPRLSGELKAYQRVMEAGRIPDPYDDITTGKQLDMLWAEFFATGNVKPIRQIISSLNLVEHLGTLDKIKAGELDPEKVEVYRAGMLESVFQAALWSLRSNCRSVPLVYQYCIGILNSEELEKPAERCLGMLLQSIANESRKPTEE